MFPKAMFSARYSSPCILPLSVLWSIPIPLTTTFMQMTLSSSSLSIHFTLTEAFVTSKTLFNRSFPGWLLIFFLLTPLRLNSCSSDSKTNLRKYTTLYLIFSDQITSISKAGYYHIRQLRCIRPNLDSSTACTIATFIVQSKLDYCNYLYYKLPKYQFSNRSKTLSLVLSLKLLRPVISLPSYALFIGLESPTLSNTSSSQLLTKFLQLLNLHTFMT